MARTQADTREGARQRGREDGLLRERGECRLGERGAVDVAHVCAPVTLRDAHDTSSRQDLARRLLRYLARVHLLSLLELSLETRTLVALDVVVLERN